MNRDEKEALRENSLDGVDEFARDVTGFPAFLSTLAIDQLIKPTISEVVSPWRKKAVHGAKSSTAKAVRKTVSKSPNEQSSQADHNEDSDEKS